MILYKRCICLILFISLVSSLQASAQDSPVPKGEVKAIIRISKQFMDDSVAKKDIVATIPYRAIIVGFDTQGVIHGRGKMSVEIIANDKEASILVIGKGTGHTYARGVRGPFVAFGPAWGPFVSRTIVRFNGKKLSRVETIPWAKVTGELQKVEGRHGGPIGRVAGRLAMPLGQLLVPHAELQAEPVAEYYLKNFVDDFADKMIAQLNRDLPLAKSLNRVFPQNKDWVFQLSANSNYIQAAYGPPGSIVPVLPDSPKRMKNARIEVFLRSTTQEARALENLSKLPLARALLDRYLETTFPELAAIAEERSITAVGPWVVIGIGEPKSK